MGDNEGMMRKANILLINLSSELHFRKVMDSLKTNSVSLWMTKTAYNRLIASYSFENVFLYEKHKNFFDNIRMIFDIRKKSYDKVILLYNGDLGIGFNFRAELFTLLCKANEKLICNSRNDEFRLTFSSLLYHSTIGKIRKKGYWNYLLSLISLKLRRPYVMGKPTYITLEPTNICNLRCPVCETGNNTIRRSRGMMSFEDYKKIIDKISDFTNTILLYYMGEPFLNKDIYRMAEYAKEKGIKVLTCTNGEYVKPEELVGSGFDYIEFVIGGIRQQTHEKYRVNGNLDRTLKNVCETVKLRNQKGSKIPIIQLDMIIMKHNEHEVEGFFKLASEIGVDQSVLIEPCVRNIEQAREYLPKDERYNLYDVEGLKKDDVIPKNKTAYKNCCDWIWFSTVIDWDGKVVPCCRDVFNQYEMGNIFKESIGKIWNSKKYRNFRKTIMKNQKSVLLCHSCFGYGRPNLL